MKKVETIEARIGVFIRVVGLVFLAVGIYLAYHTYNTPLPSPLSPIFYLISALFILSGAVALIAKLEERKS